MLLVGAGLQLTVIGALLSRPENRCCSWRDQPAPKPMDPGFGRDRLESEPATLLKAPMVGGLRSFGAEQAPNHPAKASERRVEKAL